MVREAEWLERAFTPRGDVRARTSRASRTPSTARSSTRARSARSSCGWRCACTGSPPTAARSSATSPRRGCSPTSSRSATSSSCWASPSCRSCPSATSRRAGRSTSTTARWRPRCAPTAASTSRARTSTAPRACGRASSTSARAPRTCGCCETSCSSWARARLIVAPGGHAWLDAGMTMLTRGADRLLELHAAELPQKDELCGCFWATLALRLNGEGPVEQDDVALLAGSVITSHGSVHVLPRGQARAQRLPARAARDRGRRRPPAPRRTASRCAVGELTDGGWPPTRSAASTHPACARCCARRPRHGSPSC